MNWEEEELEERRATPGWYDQKGREMGSVERFNCLDCDTDTLSIGQYYSVQDEIWAESGLGSLDGMLCIGCLEKRIGRKLQPGDFEVTPAQMMERFKERVAM